MNVMEPKDDGLMMAGFWVLQRSEGKNGTVVSACQITGRDCSYLDVDGHFGESDCRKCNIPIVAALDKLAKMGAK